MYLVFCVIWGVIAYLIANKCKEKYSGLDVEPTLYFLGTVLVGIIIPMIYLAIKVNSYKKYSK